MDGNDRRVRWIVERDVEPVGARADVGRVGGLKLERIGGERRKLVPVCFDLGDERRKTLVDEVSRNGCRSEGVDVVAEASEEDDAVVVVGRDVRKGQNSDFPVECKEQLPAESGIALDSGARFFGCVFGEGAPELVSPFSLGVAELGDVSDKHGCKGGKLVGDKNKNKVLLLAKAFVI